MRRFLPFVFALAFTTLAVAFTLVVIRPGMRHKLAEVIEEITEREEEDDR
jgi:hypothetical protein